MGVYLLSSKELFGRQALFVHPCRRVGASSNAMAKMSSSTGTGFLTITSQASGPEMALFGDKGSSPPSLCLALVPSILKYPNEMLVHECFALGSDSLTAAICKPWAGHWPNTHTWFLVGILNDLGKSHERCPLVLDEVELMVF